MNSKLIELQEEIIRLRSQIVSLQQIGGQLANCAFNLKQRRKELDENDRKSLETVQEEWDDLIASINEANRSKNAQYTVPSPPEPAPENIVIREGSCRIRSKNGKIIG